MKKILYFLLLAAELFVDVLFIIALLNSYLYIPIAVAAIVLVIALTKHIISLNKTTDPKAKRRIKFKIVLSMLIPVAVYAVTYVVIAIAFIIAFTFGGF